MARPPTRRRRRTPPAPSAARLRGRSVPRRASPPTSSKTGACTGGTSEPAPPPRPPQLPPPSLAPGRWTAVSTRLRTPRSIVALPWPAPGGTGHACSSWPPSPSPSASALRSGARSRLLGARRFFFATTRVLESAPRASRPRDWRCSCSRRSPQLSQGCLRYLMAPAGHPGTAFALPTTTATAAASAVPMPTTRFASFTPTAPSK